MEVMFLEAKQCMVQQNNINYVKVLGMILLIIICHEDGFEHQNKRDVMV
jgi:hypothetical protein